MYLYETLLLTWQKYFYFYFFFKHVLS